MRKPIIAGNWKMNKTASETIELIEAIKNKELDMDVETVICTPTINLALAKDLTKEIHIKVGAQNMYFEEEGAFTGETSANMLKDLSIEYVVLGHSERREIFKESNEDINKKVVQALKNDLNPILCVGETLEEREMGKEKMVVEEQLQLGLKDSKADQFEKIVIAYEPVWAIGTGKTASSDDAETMCKFIRDYVRKDFGNHAANMVRIQYGGSVKPDNVKDIMSKDNIDGALVGGASLNAESFAELVNFKK